MFRTPKKALRVTALALPMWGIIAGMSIACPTPAMAQAAAPADSPTPTDVPAKKAQHHQHTKAEQHLPIPEEIEQRLSGTNVPTPPTPDQPVTPDRGEA